MAKGLVMTLREALLTVDLDKVFYFIWKKDQNNDYKHQPSLEKIKRNYTHVVEELLSKPRVKPYKFSWLIQETEDWYDKHLYVDVCMLNNKYVAPKKGLKPWGGEKGKKLPKGHYDCNAEKHNKTFACGFIGWSKLIDTPIINTTKYSLEESLAELLWELTFYGWSEKSCEEKKNEIVEKCEEAKEEIKNGNCVTLSTQKNDTFTVVIPDSVAKDIIDIANGKNKKK